MTFNEEMEQKLLDMRKEILEHMAESNSEFKDIAGTMSIKDSIDSAADDIAIKKLEVINKPRSQPASRHRKGRWTESTQVGTAPALRCGKKNPRGAAPGTAVRRPLPGLQERRRAATPLLDNKRPSGNPRRLFSYTMNGVGLFLGDGRFRPVAGEDLDVAGEFQKPFATLDDIAVASSVQVGSSDASAEQSVSGEQEMPRPHG
jgi:hypothetical protein